MPQSRRLGGSALWILMLVPAIGMAQTPADRPFIDSLFAELSGGVPPLARCAGREASLQRLCEGLVATRQAESSNDKGDATRGRDLLERVVADRPIWPVAWYGLGVARLQVARTGGLSRAGALHPVGVSNEAGAGYALVRALELDSTFTQAMDALALASLPREGASRLGERLAMLVRVQSHLSTRALYGAGLVAVESGDGAGAVSFLTEALAKPGAQTGLISLILARGHYQAGSPAEGRDALIAGASDSTSASVAAYRRELEWVADRGELARWDSLPPAARPGFIGDFWALRDVEDGRADGARLVEHYTRMEFAFKEFKRVVPQVGLQKHPGVAMTVDYGWDEEALKAILNPHRTLSPEEKELQRMLLDAQTIGADNPFHAFRTTQTLMDDRGIIWLRHGKPDKVARTTDGLAFEVWRYDRPNESLVLQFKEENFDGQVGASVLVPSLGTINPLQREQLCHIEQSLCAGVADPRSGSGMIAITAGTDGFSSNASAARFAADTKLNTTGRLQRLYRDGNDAIATATTTDDFAIRFPNGISPVVQLYGLDRSSGGAGRAVVAFAIPGSQLSYTTPPEAGGRSVYDVHVQLLISRRSDGARFDLDTLRRFATAAPLADGQFLTGFVELPLPPGRYVASVILSQSDRGAIARLSGATVPSAGGRLAVSDMVLGSAGSGVRWSSGTMAVPLNPLNAYAKGGAAEVYYQVSGLAPGTEFESKLELYGADDKPGKAPQLAIGFKTKAAVARTEVSRSLGLQNLKPGRYRVRLTVTRGGESAEAVAWLTVLK